MLVKGGRYAYGCVQRAGGCSQNLKWSYKSSAIVKQFQSCLWKCIRDLCVNLLLLQLSGVVALFQQAMFNKWRFRESAFDNALIYSVGCASQAGCLRWL